MFGFGKKDNQNPYRVPEQHSPTHSGSNSPRTMNNPGLPRRAPTQGQPMPPHHQTPPPQQHRQPPSGHGGDMILGVGKDKAFALANLLEVPPGTFADGDYVIINNQHVFTVRQSPHAAPGQILAGAVQRRWAALSTNMTVHVAPYDPFHKTQQVYLGNLELEIDFLSASAASGAGSRSFEPEKLAHHFLHQYANQIFTPGQTLAMDFEGLNFQIRVLSTSVVNLGDAGGVAARNVRGILVRHTDIGFNKAKGSAMNLKSAKNKPRQNAIIQPDFKFQDLGIGGLDAQFGNIFRRAFASRIYSPADVEALGINHVKGILLFGPPGTGKTLIARQIGKMLNAREPKIVNGPEILNKYVGASEENIRNLFKDAEAEYREKGDDSGLHIIIFDELDAVFKQRGSTGGGTGVGDNVVNQLLAKMDGVEQLNNILVIGMTNRKDLIDSALMRPGRFEVQIEIPLPDEAGRLQILKIHTAPMTAAGKLGRDVDLNELAGETKNYSGAEIKGLLNSAASYAFTRNLKLDQGGGGVRQEKGGELMLMRDDFVHALQEVRPAFGVSEEDLDAAVSGGIIKYSPNIDDILKKGELFIERVRQSSGDRALASLLLHGPAGSGKTALAASIAMQSNFPFVRLISPEGYVGMSEASKITAIQNCFLDAYKSPLSVIVIDSIEIILEWVQIGPRFSNSLLQAVKTLCRKTPPKGCRLLILVTTHERHVLEQMDLISAFDSEIGVPYLQSLKELNKVLDAMQFLDSPEARHRVVQSIEAKTGSTVPSIGIKTLLSGLKTAQYSSDVEEEFVDFMVDHINARRNKYV
ncbi:P-loop containing nucleoside triphosphate hydrolase protein [Yarrowia lipolytica]|uniref:Vesicular-fusion protein SEC18 n=2 Tax=Yarrowia lipolytica TaxID=4952 RepID=Q6C470_YARLI|nr:YALI0E29249p [Yarrowia lipolytica CLIB122]AOW06123.1 hypothetical protein YALI1_E34525g [Yarrowia lipolytica]KAB8285603.1 P-loop containing nucleoside triphosphate hydrolase protein [Yarrowia lipolytica]KAE8175309.1 P-loop containing nucleoside triphosphate hydrolase protein [Yarrowia lipolytica]KAJ8057519.1 P-loop containing nucleoside triphosphate hydrolase protein [Yarrowia lipolytica]QNP99269.1 Vesicular-fusion protein SEC18 [Yarrowia lipolytica]|eukprot:XP_504542.1 YALI0E29249p [Yarrowia lipolytica CLIB122]